MKTIETRYSYIDTRKAEYLSIKKSMEHSILLKDIFERAICRYYGVEKISHVNMTFLTRECHFVDGIPFKFSWNAEAGSGSAIDIKSGRVIVSSEGFDVSRSEMDASTVSEKITEVTISITQDVSTFDGAI